MIKSFVHKGLEAFFKTGSKAGIRPTHAAKLHTLLSALNRAESALDMNAPGWDLHTLHGDLAGYWSVKVNANWRVIFKFVEQNAEVVDYLDYH
ncbi:peptidase [Advenella kashmirensis W13003]|uniref:Peptidase n=1 Tax=Advenella kashmirensis W13003 TaxID=1424334 RepID=V8QKH2_9BURK|nr:type II toxin-antitoxin system RelE/ParE family toxin [Advenella kashmirensis]ETF00446.1 peptidase [Advenella kashmirensis W13003]